ncbi:MAG: hypothetical protein ACRC9V_07215, partial [Aeromonas sp.]
TAAAVGNSDKGPCWDGTAAAVEIQIKAPAGEAMLRQWEMQKRLLLGWHCCGSGICRKGSCWGGNAAAVGNTDKGSFVWSVLLCLMK